MDCPYCEKPLICESCGDDYNPSGPAEYEALSRPEVPIACNGCGSTLVCRWCKACYDGQDGDDEGGDGYA